MPKNPDTITCFQLSRHLIISNEKQKIANVKKCQPWIFRGSLFVFGLKHTHKQYKIIWLTLTKC